MTVIKLFSRRDSFLPFVKRWPLKQAECLEKGPILSSPSRRVREDYRLNIGFSRKSWDDLRGQVQDAKRFLRKHGAWIRKAIKHHRLCGGPCGAYIDFPIHSRLSDRIVGQNDFFDAELLSLCGKVGLGINLTTYHKDSFDRAVDRAWASTQRSKKQPRRS